MKVELTKSQCYNIAEFIETNLLDTIRKNVDLDNFGYLEDLEVSEEINACSIEVKINNQKHTNLTFINIDKGFNVTIKGLKNLSDGLNEISVKACDTEDNESTLTWKVVKNNDLPNMYFENKTEGIVGVSNKLDFYTDSLDFSNINLVIKYNPLKVKVDEIITSSTGYISIIDFIKIKYKSP